MPTDAPSGSARERILEGTAELLLAATTADDVSIRDVCQAAQVQPPSVYRAFGDKRGLLEAVVSYGYEQYAAVGREREPSGDPVADLATGWDEHVAFGVSHPAFYHLMYGSQRVGVECAAAQEIQVVLRARLESIARVGRLRVSVEHATDIATAAGVGVTLTLIERGLPADAPLSTSLREAVFAAIIDDEPTSHDPLARSAAALAATVEATPALPLSPGERALLAELLVRLAGP